MPSEQARAGLRPQLVWQVAWRDLLSTLRDRRTLLSGILVPMLIIPLLTLGMPLLMGNLMGQQAQSRQKVGVVGVLPDGLRQVLEAGGSSHQAGQRRAAPDQPVPDQLAQGRGLELVPVTDPIQAVQSGQVDAAVQVTRPVPPQAGAQGQASGELTLYAKLGSLKAQAGAFAKVQEAVSRYNHLQTVARLKVLGLPESVLTPVAVKSVDASPPQEQKSGQLAFLIPMLMLQFILSGAMATALDSTAGEKERGTLESLLVSPVRRGEVVAGKLLATTIMALTTALCSLLGFVLAGIAGTALTSSTNRQVMQMMGGQLTLHAGGVAALLGTVVSAALVISALLIALSIYARSYKEAQTYVAPLSMLIVIPAVALQFADFLRLGGVLYAVPVFGSMVTILDIVKGAVTPGHVLMAMAANGVTALLLGLLALRSFGREEVIFRN